MDDRWFAVAGTAAVELEQRGRGYQIAELGVAIAAGIEVRALLGDDVADGRERGPAVVIGGVLAAGIGELLAQLNAHLDDAKLELLSDAVDHHSDVLIVYRDKNGSRSTREIRPQQLYGTWLDSWCHLRNSQRDFTIANIEAVAPAR